MKILINNRGGPVNPIGPAVSSFLVSTSNLLFILLILFLLIL
nr:MAG TPA: hypothetical protein [Caudoviricetes sp.]